MKTSFEHGRPVPTVAPEIHGDENEHPDGERGEVAKGILQIVSKGRTGSARLLRLETLAMLVHSTGAATTPDIVATRCGCTARRARQVDREMRDFLFGAGDRR
jgi:hypothetical protein